MGERSLGKETDAELLVKLIDMKEQERLDKLGVLSESEQRMFRYNWPLFARRPQLAPPGDWRLWLILAGRGFGKTRGGPSGSDRWRAPGRKRASR